jgi:hypothetical protein
MTRPAAFIGFMTSPNPRRPRRANTTAFLGKVNSADKLYLVIESVKPDTKHGRYSTVPAPADGAGGKTSGTRLPGSPAAGAGVCPPGPAAAFGSTKTGQSGAVLFRR